MPTWNIPLKTRQKFWSGNGWNLTEGADTSTGLKARFWTNSGTWDIASVEFVSTPEATEIATTSGNPGYTQGDGNGIAVTNPTVTVDTVNDRVEFDCDDITIGQDPSGPTNIRKVSLSRNNEDDDAAVVVAYGDFGADKSVQSGDLTVQMNAEGVMYW